MQMKLLMNCLIFDSLCPRYQGNLKASMRGSDFVFDSVQLMYYKRDKVKIQMINVFNMQQ